MDSSNLILINAVIEGNVQKVKELIAEGADVASGNPLIKAACFNFHEIAELLIQAGANVEELDENLNTPLHWAAVEGCVEVMELLLENKVKVNPKDKRGFTPLNLATHWGRKENYFKVIELLLCHGADPALPANGGETPLKGAMQRDFQNAVTLSAKKAQRSNLQRQVSNDHGP